MAVIMFSLATVSVAQNRGRAGRNKAKAKKEVKQADPRIEKMVRATQDIIFIDSVVVDKSSFLAHYRLDPEAGAIFRYNDFFNTADQPNAYLYVNEMKDKCYYAVEDTAGRMQLCASDLLGDEWTKGAALGGLADTTKFQTANYPFMMPDGVTLYFAATGKESIGGYDIFVTRYDSESGSFLRPENIGMPFNSTANDYMYAIDEFCNLGWFVTDRNQDGGKVCIYVFIPSETRRTYSADVFGDEQLNSFARLERIANTWGNGAERKKAMERLAAVSSGRAGERYASINFVVNDNTVYRSVADFRSTKNAEAYRTLVEMKNQLAAAEGELERQRAAYRSAPAAAKAAAGSGIQKAERNVETLAIKIKKLEKDIRNSENNKQ